MNLPVNGPLHGIVRFGSGRLDVHELRQATSSRRLPSQRRARVLALTLLCAVVLGDRGAPRSPRHPLNGPVATLVAMRANLEKSALFAGQRLAGPTIGTAVAALFLLTFDGRTALEVALSSAAWRRPSGR